MLYLISYFTVILCTWKYFAEVINVFNTCKDFCIKIIIVKIFFFQSGSRPWQCARTLKLGNRGLAISHQPTSWVSALHSSLCLSASWLRALFGSLPSLAIWTCPSNDIYLASRCSLNQHLHVNLVSSAESSLRLIPGRGLSKKNLNAFFCTVAEPTYFRAIFNTRAFWKNKQARG